VAAIEQPKRANAWLTELLVRRMDGGQPMETDVEASLQSVALVFAGIASSRTGQAVHVQDMLDKAAREAGQRL
jgi:hypothetical protein